ncbi:MAG: precorrin-6y C5,15-methyltransferase (decarboxylating) subunit CbiE [Firmicutes bacterium HGW-Firmicutes-13]|nr:MAG: precorrin-6y C5,15-methyltransferase (decarboxylating) subunit CbiE [Firmicutes bacterium HGW-Firmicutes-13]
MCSNITIVGIGPGSLDYLPPVAKREIEDADVLIGGSRALDLFSYLNKESFLIKGDLEEAAAYIRRLPPHKKIAVLVSGDPGFYSFLNYLKKHFPAQLFKVVPGISSIQVAFARIKASWHDAHLLSLHGRRLENLASYLEGKLKENGKVAILTDSKLTPDGIARMLLEEGFTDRKVYVMSDLTLITERVIKLSLKELAQKEEKGNSVVVLEDV